jgi:hypothetical protein
MLTIDFEDAIAELLHQIYSAAHKGQDFATARSCSAIVPTKRPPLRLVTGSYNADLLAQPLL